MSPFLQICIHLRAHAQTWICMRRCLDGSTSHVNSVIPTEGGILWCFVYVFLKVAYSIVIHASVILRGERENFGFRSLIG